jgi:hypothetical protein
MAVADEENEEGHMSAAVVGMLGLARVRSQRLDAQVRLPDTWLILLFRFELFQANEYRAVV